MKRFGQALIGTIIGRLIIAAIIIMVPALLEETFALNDWLSKPFKLLAEWKAEGALAGRAKFTVLLLIYGSMLAFAAAFIFNRIKAKTPAAVPYRSRNNYERMIAEVKEAVNNRQASKELKYEKITGLFDALIDDVCNLFQLQRADVRAVLVVNSRGNHKLTGWRWGRACSIDQERMDTKAIAKFLETELTYPIWQEVKSHFDHTDSDTLLFIRNSGTLGLGCLIAIADPVDVEAHIGEWEQIVKPFTMLGHMDKLVQFVVKYS
ncbi:hypothetical protein [Paenibacillus contaminans]|uniref:Uncharacterized protein n=1 Tax=Paenibacillus contaminans TaxID=450362 RepID=A0A329MNB9_9BACL|nr:hypothetical protein [Paenibacillus contaminans]RAV21365.1 hypothetical protein DQG23_11975 [Paenibacillus contaminans]